MIQHDSRQDSGAEPAGDLDWLADRFVLGELSQADERLVLDRLAADDRLAAAVARSSRLVAALEVTRPVGPRPTAQATRPGRGKVAVGLAAVAAAVALVACWPVLAPRLAGPVAAGGPQEVVRLWRQADEAAWAEEDPPAEDEAIDGDAVPDWMLAAVGLDVASALEPSVQEN